MSEVKISTGHPDAGRIYAEALDRVTAERDAERRRADVAVADANDAESAGKKVSELLATRTAERDAALAELKTQTLRADAAVGDANEAEQRLTAADERAVALETALLKIKARLDAYAEADMRMPEPSVEVCQMIADAALKPAEGCGDDP